ncbi:MAG TPA: hypothetical protein VEU06_07800 [Micropepsaceae bacterium]|nr:hypothetical protein [Micropepsaceae bacterium]
MLLIGLFAIELDDQMSLETNEISNVLANRVLPPEFESAESAVADHPPEFLLRVCLPMTHALRVRAL